MTSAKTTHLFITGKVYSVSSTSLVRGFWEERFYTEKPRTTEGPRTTEDAFRHGIHANKTNNDHEIVLNDVISGIVCSYECILSMLCLVVALQ